MCGEELSRTNTSKVCLYIHNIHTLHTYSEHSEMAHKRVSFQTSCDPTVEDEAMRTFLVFESGESGDLNFNEFQGAVEQIGISIGDQKVIQYLGEIKNLTSTTRSNKPRSNTFCI